MNQQLEIMYITRNGDDADFISAMLVRSGYKKKYIRLFDNLVSALHHIDVSLHRRITFIDEAIISKKDAKEIISKIALQSPCIILCESVRPRVTKQLLALGVQDVVIKPDLSVNTIKKAIYNAVERHELRRRLHEMSLVDSLTGLYNHRGFMLFAERGVELAIRMRTGVSLFFIDIDHMKWINDTWGHEEGDYILRETAILLQQAFRNTDVVARIGGDEFAILSLHKKEDADIPMLDRLTVSISGKQNTWNKSYPFSLSVGVASVEEPSPGVLVQMLSNADQEMYRNKKYRRGQRPES